MTLFSGHVSVYANGDGRVRYGVLLCGLRLVRRPYLKCVETVSSGYEVPGNGLELTGFRKRVRCSVVMDGIIASFCADYRRDAN